jgi:hypothetical protein
MILHVLIFLLISCKPKDPEPKPQYKLSVGSTIGGGKIRIEPFVFLLLLKKVKKHCFDWRRNRFNNFSWMDREDNGSLVLESEVQLYSIEQVKSILYCIHE